MRGRSIALIAVQKRVLTHPAGKVLPIGGVKEKTIAAQRANVKHLILPETNRRDFEELPAHIRRGLRVHYASDYADVYEASFGDAKGEPAIVHKPKPHKGKKEAAENEDALVADVAEAEVPEEEIVAVEEVTKVKVKKEAPKKKAPKKALKMRAPPVFDMPKPTARKGSKSAKTATKKTVRKASAEQ